MNAQILGIYPFREKYSIATIFGHTSNGIPGLEIVGLGKEVKVIKEKIIYLGKVRRLRVPLKRYVLCVEDHHLQYHVGKKGEEAFASMSYLELPLLILYWRLTGHLLIDSLEDCFCGGKVSISGTIQEVVLEGHFLNALNEKLKKQQKKLKYLASIPFYSRENIFFISLKELLGKKMAIA